MRTARDRHDARPSRPLCMTVDGSSSVGRFSAGGLEPSEGSAVHSRRRVSCASSPSEATWRALAAAAGAKSGPDVGCAWHRSRSPGPGGFQAGARFRRGFGLGAMDTVSSASGLVRARSLACNYTPAPLLAPPAWTWSRRNRACARGSRQPAPSLMAF